MQKFELQINNILNVSEQYDSILSLNSVLTVLSEYYLATAILSMAIFFSISPKIQSRSFKQTKFSLFFSISFQFNYLAILIIFFYCFLSVKQNFLFLSDFVSFNNSLHNDFISLLSKLIIGISSLVYLIFVQQFLTDQKLNYFEYYILILTSILGFCLLCCSDDLLTAYLAIELQSLAFYVLASFKRSSNYSVESGVKYFILGSFSTIIFLFGSNLIYGLSGSISIIDFKDLFVWVFSANSFFLSFDSISKALESFPDKTFKLENNNLKDVQTIYDKFLILKTKTSLSSLDLNTLLLEFDNGQTFFLKENLDTQKLSLYKNISQKMIQIANQIDSSSSHYYSNHLKNSNEVSSSIQFAKDLVIDNLIQNLSVWFINDMQNLGNKYNDIFDFKQDLLSVNCYSDLLNKFKYNWFLIENLVSYSNDLEYISSILTKNQTFNDINEFFYFTHLSHSLDVLQSENCGNNLVDNNVSQKLFIILEKLKLLGYISFSDANLLLSEIQNLLINKMSHDQKLQETNLFSEDETYFYKTFSEILTNIFKKKNLNLDILNNSKDLDKVFELCFKTFLFIDSLASLLENLNVSQYFVDSLVLNNLTDLSSCLSKSLVLDNNKTTLDYFYIISTFLPYFVQTQDIYSDSDFKNVLINDDFKLNYNQEKLFHIKNIAEKFKLLGSETTLSLQEIKSLLFSSKDLLTSNFYTAEKAELFKTIANFMKSFYIQDEAIYNDRIKKLKNVNEFQSLLLDFKTSSLELKKVLLGCINSLEDTFKLNDSLNLSFSEVAESSYHLTFIDKFYQLDSENLPLLLNTGKLDVSNLPAFDSEKYYSIYEKCINTFEIKDDDNFSCIQIVDNNLVDFRTSKKTWFIKPEFDYYKDLITIIDYALYYSDLSDFLKNSSLLPNSLSAEQKFGFLKFLILKLKNENFILTKWEFEFLLTEMKDIFYNVTNIEKRKLYLELSQILDLTFNKFNNDVFFSKISKLKPDNHREFVNEMFQFYLETKNLLLESDLKHLIISKTLASLYQTENIDSQYNYKFSEINLTDNIKLSSFNITQNNESIIISIAHVLTLFSLFFNFSLDETSLNFIFDTSLIELGVITILISLFFKLALSPFHLWSPDVYEGSPSSSTFFFTVISKLSIFVFLLKICYISFFSFISNWQFYSLIVAIISILVGSIGGLKQRKFKSILAYSSISNMGLILVSFSAGNFEGIKAFFYFFILYIISGLAVWSIFLLLKFKKKIPSEKHNKDLGDFSMLHELNVILAYASVITIFTIAGIPPMVGFLAKVSIFLSLTEASMYFIALISILASVISTFFYLRILKVIFFENILVGKLFYPTNSKDNIIRSLLFFLIIFLFISPVLPNFLAYKTTLFLNKNFY